MTCRVDDLNLELRRPDITFFVQGTPKAQPRIRARAFKFGNKIATQIYDPGTAADWKRRVWDEAWRVRPAVRLDRPCRVELRFYFKRPESLCRLRDPVVPFPHGRKPDADNLAKAMLDVLTEQGWWRDDGVVSELLVIKLWGGKYSSEFGVRVFVSEELGND